MAEQITVEGTGVELIQTEQSAVQATVETRQIVDLPINGRNPAQLVNLVPGMRYTRRTGFERGNEVQGVGVPVENTEFQIDGLNANAGMDERGITIPNVDTISEFRVETSSFSAENGRQPIQMIMATKAGTNELHGALWEFLRNENLDARNTFATRIPKLTQNQFGGTVGGPIVRNRTFFFFSTEQNRQRREQIYNRATIHPDMLRGDFSSVSSAITNPYSGESFANNMIPMSEVSPASEFFFHFIPLPTHAGNRYRIVAPRPDDSWEYISRIDHQVNDSHRIYGRWIVTNNVNNALGTRPDIYRQTDTRQNNLGVNYAYTINPTTLLNMNWGYTRSLANFTNPWVGAEVGNLTEQAGIRGFPTEGRDEHVGIPTVGVTGYTAYAPPWGGRGRLWFEAYNSKVNLNMVRGRHTITVGAEYNTRSTYGNHGSCCARGNFSFNGQYTGDGFADYFLGLVSTARRNYPIQTFGMADSPYTGIYFNDAWKVTNKLTINLGLRHDHWYEKAAIRGNHATFDLDSGFAVAGEDTNGNVDLTSQPVAPALAKFTEGLWKPASELGIPRGLFKPDTIFSPRVGLAYRPLGSSDVVVRVGYGIFPMQFTGNRSASAIIGPPYWNFEVAGFNAAENQRWETAFPDDPNSFLGVSVAAPKWDLRAQQTHEWNTSVQFAMPAKSALTLLVCRQLHHPGSHRRFRAVQRPAARPVRTTCKPPGPYPAIRQYPDGEQLRQTLGTTPLTSSGNAASRTAGCSPWPTPREGTWSSSGVSPTLPIRTTGGRNVQDRTHILSFNTVYELPLGRGRKLLPDANPVVDAILGGWQVSGIYRFWSGSPLSINVPGATLGNGRGTRADLTGDPNLSDPNPGGWFNTAAFSAPARYSFGNSTIGLMDGPGEHVIDTGLMKNFYITEGKYVQFRWEMFNMPNHVNYNNPNTNFGLAGRTGRIFFGQTCKGHAVRPECSSTDRPACSRLTSFETRRGNPAGFSFCASSKSREPATAAPASGYDAKASGFMTTPRSFVFVAGHRRSERPVACRG